MLDAENIEGGLLSINYQRLSPLHMTDEELISSATIGHLTKATQGISQGFLCEKMGLGKTIEVFSYIHRIFHYCELTFIFVKKFYAFCGSHGCRSLH